MQPTPINKNVCTTLYKVESCTDLQQAITIFNPLDRVKKSKQMLYKLPVVRNRKGDLSKNWYVEYHFFEATCNDYKCIRTYISSKYKTVAERTKQANKICNELTNQLQNGFNPFALDLVNTPNVNVFEALCFVIEFKKQFCKQRTELTYAHTARKFYQWLTAQALNNLYVVQLTTHHCRAYLDYILIIEKVKSRTYNNHLVHLKMLFNFLLEREMILKNPFSGIKKLPKTEAAICTYTDFEKNTIKEKLPSIHGELFLSAMLIYYCFIRPAEQVRLQFRDVHAEKNIIIIPADKSKNKKTQPVIMPKYLKQLWYKMGYDKQSPDNYIFSNAHKLTPGTKKIAPTRIAEMWNLFVQKGMGIKKGIYLFKHTGVGELFESGADARNIQLQMRHHSLDETQTYLNKFRNEPSEILHQFYKDF